MKSNQFIVNEVELVYTPKMYQGEETKVLNSLTAALILRQAYNDNTIYFQEESIVLFLNNANEIICINKLSRGGITSTVVDCRILLATALKCMATGVIISHNHPSGKTQPSDNDVQLTKRLKDACELVEIKLLDHIIITPSSGYYSFVDAGLLS
jgi:DNA repair protein RadC